MRLYLLILSSVLMIIAGGCFDKPLKDSRFIHTDHEEIKQDDQTQSEHIKKSEINYGPSHPSYEIEVKYDSINHEISGDINVEFTNNLHTTLNEVYFNLWPKAFNFVGGDINVYNVRYNGEKTDFAIDNNHLEVSGFSLQKDNRAKISMAFTVQVPEQRHRFGWDGNSVSLGNWFPILAVYDANGWNLYPYFDAGESFYSLTSDYDVTLTTDENMVVAATGKQVGNVRKKDGLATHHFEAQNVRDFAIQMDPNYDVETVLVDDIQMNVYYTEKQEKGGFKDYMIESGRQALEIFNYKIGQYAWDELNIVGMDCEFGGMEYPQLVMICGNENYSEDYIHSIVAHEIAHQWFYAAVGNNQYMEPWLDESFASFMEELGKNDLKSLPDHEFKKPKHPYRLNSSISTFRQEGGKGIEAYDEYIYGYGTKTLNDLRIELGDDLFYKGMSQYYQEMTFKVATTQDFIRIMEEATGKNLAKFFKKHSIEVNQQNTKQVNIVQVNAPHVIKWGFFISLAELIGT